MDPSKKKKYRSQKAAERSSLAASYIVLTILALIWLIPIVWIVLASLSKNSGTVAEVKDYIPSSGIGFENFRLLFTKNY